MSSKKASEEQRKLIELLKQIPWAESELQLLIEATLKCSDERAKEFREKFEHTFEGLPKAVKNIRKLFDEYLQKKGKK